MATTGIAVGKFNPPHLGHLHLVERGAAEVDQLFVLLCQRADQTLSGEQRRSWLADAVPPNVTILITPDDLPEANEPWARRALELLPSAPDKAFTSEEWGPGWAELMGAEHVMIDLERSAVPITATELRADLGRTFRWLVPAARQALARRIVLIGAESTGKTTMAEALARELDTVWVPEHGRWYWEGRRHLQDQSWTSDELRRVARSQRRLEDDLARRSSNGLVISDTDALVTAVWHERYLGAPDPELDALASMNPPALYLSCCPDFEWVQDGTRDSKAQRAAFQRSLQARTEASGVPVVHLSGSHDERLAEALKAIRPLTRFSKLV